MKVLISRINAFIPAITLCFVIGCLVLLVKQQSEISKLKIQLASVYSSVDDNDTKLNDIDNKIDNVEGTLSDDIEDVRKTVITWSH
jgi:peptidoglycan hydrolase CwlO-like protein